MIEGQLTEREATPVMGDRLKSAASPRAGSANADGSGEKKVTLILFVVSRTPNSQRAMENLQALLGRELSVDVETEVVDIKDNPERAQEEQVIAIPTLLRKGGGLSARVVGDLSDIDTAIAELQLA